MVLLEHFNVPGGMSSHLYYSPMSSDHPVQSIFPSAHPRYIHGGSIQFQRMYHHNELVNSLKKIDLACWVKETAWKFLT